MQQMKEQDKNPSDQTNEEEIGNLPEKEFRVMIVKMIQDRKLRRQRNTQQKRSKVKMHEMKQMKRK